MVRNRIIIIIFIYLLFIYLFIFIIIILLLLLLFYYFSTLGSKKSGGLEAQKSKKTEAGVARHLNHHGERKCLRIFIIT